MKKHKYISRTLRSQSELLPSGRRCRRWMCESSSFFRLEGGKVDTACLFCVVPRLLNTCGCIVMWCLWLKVQIETVFYLYMGLTRIQRSPVVCLVLHGHPSPSYWSWRAEAWSWKIHNVFYITIWYFPLKQIFNFTQVNFWIPDSILHYAVLAGPPTGARMVTLKDERRLLTAEFR